MCSRSVVVDLPREKLPTVCKMFVPTRPFRTTVFVLKDGETVSGLMRREEGGAFIYALANGQEARVAKADVKERRETETSLMPANFIEALTAVELNDLLAFLLGKSGK